MPKIFISYRRMDSGSEADIIHNYMMRHFGKNNVFIDVESIPVGRNFRNYLSEQVASNDVVLVIIGSEWARIMKERAHQDNDFVRIEIESALAQHKLVIPVLVKGAKMPDFTDLPASINELQWLNSIEIRRKPDLDDDCAKLAEGIKEYFKSQRQHSRWLYGGVIIGILVILIVLVGVLSTLGGSDKNDTKTPSDVANLPTASITTMIETLTDSAIPSQTDEVTSTQTPTTTESPTAEPTIQNTDTFTPMPSDTPTHTAMPSPTSTLSPQELKELAETSISRNDDWIPHSEIIKGIEMVLVPKGCFIMGSDDGDSDEQSGQQFCFANPFWLSKYEITNAQYGSDGCSETAGDEFPHSCVRWFDAQSFCEDQGARLPTEAEWEYAARGPDNLVYPWGNEFIAEYVVYSDNADRLAPIGSKPDGASWVGAMDMGGNISEWVNTIYDADVHPYPYATDDGREEIATNEDDTRHRVFRGGSWVNSTYGVRSANRINEYPFYVNHSLGFRCASNY